MLICPQCQSENANTNKFCQGCGTPLTFKFCPECGTQVALNAKLCHNCGAQTGTVWWAIVMGVVETQEGSPVSNSGVVEVLDVAGEPKIVESLPSSISQQKSEGTAPPAPLALSLTTHHSPLTTHHFCFTSRSLFRSTAALSVARSVGNAFESKRSRRDASESPRLPAISTFSFRG